MTTDEGGRGPGPSMWVRGRVPAVLALVTGVLLAFPKVVPNGVGRLGSLLEAFLPWLGLVVLPLAVCALLRRSATALLALVVPVAAWAYQFGPLLLPGADSGRPGLEVVQHNVSDENADPAGTARTLAAAGPELIALEELLPRDLPAYRRALAADYPYHAVHGTVGLWSAYPLSGNRVVDIRPRSVDEGWSRGLRAVVHAPRRDVAVYVAHLPSVRVTATGFASALRDESAGLLGSAIAREPVGTVVLLGDLNGTVDDRGLGPLTSRLNVSHRGFALSYPEGFPLARIDQVMARSATVGRIRALAATGSDHLPVAARVTFG
ncbi:endonuclease/exonuclease/phosphatase family protein [Streptomyces sp. NPDC052225]|uniref:endonuclease/exonuclease/phosphatase family protein n=1 Tax=Streptomyces sp. NPDC052225 TaxID=3154949 RepID=UPI00342E76CF